MKVVSCVLAVWLACFASAGALGADDAAAAKRKAAQKKQAEAAAKNFKNLDKNEDGLLTFDEFKRNRKSPEALAKGEAIFKLIDADDDMKVSLEEFQNRPPEARFKQMDRNDDGKLIFEEFKGRREKPEEIEVAERNFKRMDADGDLKVTLEEFQKAQAKRRGGKKRAKK